MFRATGYRKGKEIRFLETFAYALAEGGVIGKVIKQGKTTSRFIIQDKLGLYLISLIFNGNIRTPDKFKSFNEFLILLNLNIRKSYRKL